ncbi:acyltransferase family protein [Lacticaseibacillus brantae]|uniref:Acyltransferase n=1 Tax=Lacticaseibacillus brantae DSM 23927 TaxID=1423727 RepID=A0A0R2AZ15_9LACO|nr:acyltransferase family protein [Lacticaseibacillus brantae]KRM72577.1 acyltransferase [Lacticaseibacillus brantae DSM 23927]
MEKQQRAKRRYITGFDGLRTIGVIGVILYHLRPELFKGGYLGVPIFMVVSGYLITDGLLQEFDRSGRINFKSFFTRRLKRLYPGLIAVLFATSAYITLFSHNLLHNLHMMVITNLAYVYNWWQIFNGQSYFARFANNESPFTHLWTLSIEGQYYLIWPVIVLGFLMFVKNRTKMFNITFILAVLSAVEMAILALQMGANADPSRLYYGTDTRAFAILLGAALAFIWPSAKLSANIKGQQKLTLNVLGGISLIGMLAMVFLVGAQSSFLYLGGMFLFSLLTMILVAVVAHPGAWFNRLLSNPVFSWVGSRSYGLYLYQFPVMIFWENQFKDIADHPVLYPVIEVLIILALTELSYRLIEQPVAHFDFKKTGAFLKGLVTPSTKLGASRWVSYGALVILLIGTVGLIQAPSVKTDAADSSALAKQLKETKADKAKQEKDLAAAKSSIAAEKKAKADAKASKSISVSKQSEAESLARKHPVNQEYEKYGLTQVQLQQMQTIGMTAVGDSVMKDGEPILQALFPKAYIDATVSRQMIQSISIVQNYAKTGALADNVLIGLGTNGPFTPDQLDEMMKIIGPSRNVFWINVRVPTRSWQNDVNALLKASVSKYPNLTVIDWYGYSNSHNDWFYDDMVHPNPTGNPYYGTFVAKAILSKVDAK